MTFLLSLQQRIVDQTLPNPCLVTVAEGAAACDKISFSTTDSTPEKGYCSSPKDWTLGYGYYHSATTWLL